MRGTIVLLASFFMILGFSGRANSEPGAYFTAIHCDPQYASGQDWAALVELVESAQFYNQKLTIQLNPEWAEVIANQPGSHDLIDEWVTWGHEIGAHHHVLGHPGGWDGYTNESEENLPVPHEWPGYKGDMAAFLTDTKAMLPEGVPLVTVSSKDYDFPVGVDFQTGGSDSTPLPSDATSQPMQKLLFGNTVWNLKHAALIAAGSWQLVGMMSAFDAASSDQVLGAAVHPHDYYEGHHGPLDAWFAFLEGRDPGGSRSRTAGSILQDHVESLPEVPGASVVTSMAQATLLLGSGFWALRLSPRRRRRPGPVAASS